MGEEGGEGDSEVVGGGGGGVGEELCTEVGVDGRGKAWEEAVGDQALDSGEGGVGAEHVVGGKDSRGQGLVQPEQGDIGGGVSPRGEVARVGGAQRGACGGIEGVAEGASEGDDIGGFGSPGVAANTKATKGDWVVGDKVGVGGVAG